MIEVQDQISLLPLHTFHTACKAEALITVKGETEIREALHYVNDRNKKHLILGGGSNVLFIKDFDGFVLKNECKGITVIAEDADTIEIQVASGEIWHELVMWSMKHNYAGLENLALIPGTVGAAPMQNIGAYGVEAKDVITQVEALHKSTFVKKIFNNEECAFGYRESVFKHSLKDQYWILSVNFLLYKKNPILKMDYGDIQKVIAAQNIEQPTIQNVCDAVICIRRSKLPDPAVIGNAGSFFKNPIIDRELFIQLKKENPAIPHYDLSNTDYVKIPAGWLIENTGWKGFREGDVGVHEKQALVLVNYKNASGAQIKTLSEKIQESVLKKYKIQITPEVNFI